MYAVSITSQTVYIISTSFTPPVTPIIDTSITSAVDGNGLQVTNNTGLTVSDKITFTFEAQRAAGEL